MLKEVIKTPTININNFVGNLVVILAARGAIKIPPEISPKMISGLFTPMKMARDNPVENSNKKFCRINGSNGFFRLMTT